MKVAGIPKKPVAEEVKPVSVPQVEKPEPEEGKTTHQESGAKLNFHRHTKQSTAEHQLYRWLISLLVLSSFQR